MSLNLLLKVGILILFTSSVFAQNESNIWYFGNQADLDFNSGVPVVLTDGQLNTFKGSATISDNQGKLLFYTDGITVWDNQYKIMFNGNSIHGNLQLTQMRISFPDLDNSNKIFIFAHLN